MLALGAAPGEWAIRAERAFRKTCPDGDYMSVNVEADPVHVRMIFDFFEHHKVSQAKNIVIYAAVGERDGWASLPIVDPNNWGAGVVSFSERGIADPAVDDVRGVMCLGLPTLLKMMVGTIDYLHCDIQGAEEDIFPPHMPLLAEHVKVCCISVHGSKAERRLKEAFAYGDWTLSRDIAGDYRMGPDGEGTYKDGILIYTNRAMSAGGDLFA
jgi:hypothetical protein